MTITFPYVTFIFRSTLCPYVSYMVFIMYHTTTDISCTLAECVIHNITDNRKSIVVIYNAQIVKLEDMKKLSKIRAIKLKRNWTIFSY